MVYPDQKSKLNVLKPDAHKGRGGMEEYLHADITRQVLGAAFEVHRTLGPGFLESVYEEALTRELKRRNISFQRQLEIPISYKGDLIGTHRLDLLIEGCVIVELKTIKELADIHTAVVLSYLTATDLSIALLLNFSKPRLEFKRVFRKTPPQTSA